MRIKLLLLGSHQAEVDVTQKQYEMLLTAWHQGEKWWVLRAPMTMVDGEIEVPVGNIVAIINYAFNFVDNPTE